MERMKFCLPQVSIHHIILAEMYSCQIPIRGTIKKSHEVHVFHSLDAYKVKRKQSPKNNEQTEIYTYPVKTHFNSSSYTAYLIGNSTAIIKKFDNLINQIKPDIVHHHNISLLGYDLLRKRSNYLNLFTAHDYWLVCQQNNLLKGRTALCQPHHKGSCFFCALKCQRPPQIWRSFKGFKKAIEDINLIIAPSNFVAKTLEKKVSAKTAILPNFVPTPPSSIGPANFENYFLFVGMLEKHKGILNLLQVVKDLKRELNLG
jgi:glycosyltransferase involved in cell wall biosynthesis